MTINLTALQKQRRDTAANWTGANPTLLAGEIGIESDTLRWKAGDGSTAWTSLAYIPGLAYGTARQLLQTNSGATSAEWTSNVDIPGTLDVTGTSTLDGMVLVGLTSSIGGGKLQVSTDTATAIQSFTFSSAADTNTSTLQLVRARGTKASPSVLLNNDYIGEIRFLGYGTTYNQGATIRAVVDGEPATSGDTSDMPTKLVFLTSPNGSSTPDTRMTIDSAGLVTIPGDLTVNGTTTTINSTTLVVQDKNIEMGVVATPTDVTADGGGITLKGTTDKTINWIDSTDAWTFSEHVNIASAKEYRIAGTKVLDATSLGSAVVGSSLTSVGTISSGTWNGTAIADTYLATISTALKVSNSATTATSANTASAIVARDASGNFTAGTITATLTGNASTVTTNANLTGDVTSVGNATSIAAGVIVDADINASAAIVDTKLATISTAGKVSNSATTATDVNTASAIVARDASGNFTAGTITAALTGAASSNVLKAGDTMTGVLAVTAGTAALPAITPSGDPNTGIYSPGADQLAISTNGTGRLFINSSGDVGVGTNTAGTKLHAVGGNVWSSNFYEIGRFQKSNGTGVSLGYDNTSYVASIGAYSHDGTASSLSFWTYPGTGSALERMRLDSSGRLGLGTSSPSWLLSLRKDSSSGGSGDYPVVQINNADANGYAALYLNDSTAQAGLETRRTTGHLGMYAGGSEKARIDSSGRLGIGTTTFAASPSSRLNVKQTSNTRYDGLWIENSANEIGIGIGYDNSSDCIAFSPSYGSTGSYKGLAFYTSNLERGRWDTSGRFLVGTSTARDKFFQGGGAAQVQIEGANSFAAAEAITRNSNDADGPSLILSKARSTTYTAVQYLNGTNGDDKIGRISFQGADGTNLIPAAGIECYVDAAPGANDMPGRLVFSTTADGASSPTERMRITSAGDVLIGTTNTAPNNSSTDNGIALVKSFSGGGFVGISRASEGGLAVNRTVDDGTLVYLQQAGTVEGTISVSGTTVSYNGAHLSRWSQLPGGATREEILRGTVLSNLDEMCGWGDEDNEQLNRMQVSDIEGDKNVSGVFQAWDDDDDTYTDDFYCAMTGDFIIRIAKGVTVERGDLLMSAGDGTAKPQADDIIRSKTIAKVTSTHVTCTYEDGSYCVPCVLMAC